ncbi:hypothetical protein ACIA5G_32080 [Amycolatopsis sp. NPDC051758]|uniref:hypothetical protein n=1 Tax=Amycolatopsis sp. NPDC051758 TaxID=3363935 RepID=UPI003797C5D6
MTKLPNSSSRTSICSNSSTVGRSSSGTPSAVSGCQTVPVSAATEPSSPRVTVLISTSGTYSWPVSGCAVSAAAGSGSGGGGGGGVSPGVSALPTTSDRTAPAPATTALLTFDFGWSFTTRPPPGLR